MQQVYVLIACIDAIACAMPPTQWATEATQQGCAANFFLSAGLKLHSMPITARLPQPPANTC
ncbi:hypothetical protein GCM10027513_21570 [Giesbergeria giesbergeri]